MPYAHEGTISQDAIEGGIRITQEQYNAALDAVVSRGMEVTIDGGFAVRDPQPSAYHAWENGEWVAHVPDPPPHSPSVDDYRREIQIRVDAKAQERGYDSGHTIATYVNSTVEVWASEARAFVKWRDSVWLYAFVELDKFESGYRDLPTPEEFCEELPLLHWPV